MKKNIKFLAIILLSLFFACDKAEYKNESVNGGHFLNSFDNVPIYSAEMSEYSLSKKINISEKASGLEAEIIAFSDDERILDEDIKIIPVYDEPILESTVNNEIEEEETKADILYVIKTVNLPEAATGFYIENTADFIKSEAVIYYKSNSYSISVTKTNNLGSTNAEIKIIWDNNNQSAYYTVSEGTLKNEVSQLNYVLPNDINWHKLYIKTENKNNSDSDIIFYKH